jgi:bacterioferritin
MLRESPIRNGKPGAVPRALCPRRGSPVSLEEFAREMIQAEELHAAEVDKMLRKPGDVAAFKAGAG